MTPLTVATTPSLGAGHVMKNARYSPAATTTPPGQLPNTQGMDPCIPGVAGASDYGKDEGLCWKKMLHRVFHYDLLDMRQLEEHKNTMLQPDKPTSAQGSVR